MRYFLIELVRSLGTTWSKVWRWAFRRPLNLVVTGATLLIIIAVVAVALRPSTVPTIAASTPTPTPTEAPVPMVEVTATPIDNGSSDGDQEGDDEQPPVADPASVDTADAEAVARAWATGYFTRATPDDDAWIDAVAPFVTDDLMAELERMAFLEGTPLDGVQDTTVTDIRIEPRDPEAEANTPVRWSQTLVVDIADANDETTTLSYGVVLYLTEDGWELTSAELLGIEEG